MDEREKKLADLLINYSCKVQKGERVLIEYDDVHARDLVRQLIKNIYSAGGEAFVNIKDAQITREILMGVTEEYLSTHSGHLMSQMKDMDAYIAIRASDNISELADVPADKMSLYKRKMSPIVDERVDNTKWVVLGYPTASMAQQAEMSQEAFRDFYYKVCTLDYAKMSRAMDPLKALMDKTSQVRIEAPGTDLTFSIEGIPAIKCDGDSNIPDGEVYTAPVKDSVNGVISYNTKSLEEGFTFEDIRFEIENGKIVKATANDDERINQLLDTDEGARYFGEFAIGVNPYILDPMKDTLFDEKIAGSIHFTPGQCYDDAPNGNNSAIHWDLVLIQRPEYGGGRIWFDDVLIREDGLFVLPELEVLNPENLK